MHPNPLQNKEVSLRTQAQRKTNTLSLDARTLEQGGQRGLQQRKTIHCKHWEIHFAREGGSCMAWYGQLNCSSASISNLQNHYEMVCKRRKALSEFLIQKILFIGVVVYLFLNLWPSSLLLADDWTVPWKQNKEIASGTKDLVQSFLHICFGCHFKGTVASWLVQFLNPLLRSLTYSQQ